MAAEERRHKAKPHEYSILVVPAGEGGKTRSFRLSVLTAILIIMVSCVFVGAVTLVALVASPLASYLSIPNPELERRYAKEARETRRRLTDLSRDVLILKQYNVQLRKALGENIEPDTTLSKTLRSPDNDEESTQRPSLAGKAGATLEVAAQDRLAGATPGIPPGVFLTASSREVQTPFPLLPPIDAFVSQGFDPSRGHYGLDYAAKQGSPIHAGADGYVVFAGWTYDNGNMLIISHGGKYMTVYKHTQTLFKSAHSEVKRDEVIGLVGNSGQTSLGPHLHFELWKDGVPQDPEEYLIAVHINR